MPNKIADPVTIRELHASGKSLGEIAKIIGVSRQRIHQIVHAPVQPEPVSQPNLDTKPEILPPTPDQKNPATVIPAPIGESKRGVNKQQVFLQFYLDSTKPEFLNAYKSAIRAGYSETAALKIPVEVGRGKYTIIRQGIEQYKQKAIKSLEHSSLTPGKVLADLEEVISWLREPEKIKKYPGDMRYYLSSILKALELVGKHLEMFKDVQEHRVSGSVTIEHRVERMREALWRLNTRCPKCGTEVFPEKETPVIDAEVAQ